MVFILYIMIIFLNHIPEEIEFNNNDSNGVNIYNGH